MPRCSAPLLVVALSVVAACGTTVAVHEGGPGGGVSTSSGSTSAPILGCADVDASPCFSNLDCAATDRCHSVGTADIPVECCVPGPRGSGKGGVPCTSEDDCEIAVCTATAGGGLCSSACVTDADCPPSIPFCVTIDPAYGSGSFCAH